MIRVRYKTNFRPSYTIEFKSIQIENIGIFVSVTNLINHLFFIEKVSNIEK